MEDELNSTVDSAKMPQKEWSHLSKKNEYGELKVISRNLLSSKVRGYFQSLEALNWLINTQKMVFQRGLVDLRNFYRVVDYSEAEGSTWRMRWQYIRELKALQDEWGRPNATIVVGANPMMRAAINTSNAFLGKRIGFAKDMEQAVEIVTREMADRDKCQLATEKSKINGLFYRAIRFVKKLFKREKETITIKRQQLDDIITAIGYIAWDSGEGQMPRVSDMHPLKGMYDVLELVRQDVQNLNKERSYHEQRLTKTMAELNDANEKLKIAATHAKAASKAKGDFIANISHEIRTPMNGVIGMSNLLSGTQLNGEQKEYVKIVRSSAKALMDVINDVLDFSKIEAGKLEIEKIDFHLSSVVKEVWELLKPKADEKKLAMVFNIEKDIPAWLEGDQGRIRQILLNLVGNSIKFTSVGIITIDV
ncbi:MAG: hypothetical protein GY854_22735, partial [Deltaproteobacteria bacterium]|nr:hypothetical protein [Deltaproteobacteria bacterium]